MKIKHLRTARGLTQAALAKKVGVSREYVARLETGGCSRDTPESGGDAEVDAEE